MSEYQYYDFVAIDRRLDEREMRELRSISSRADITPTRFTNEYNWGDLKAEATELLARYFDVHVYVTNWGTRRFAMRLPLTALPVEEAEAFACSELLGVWCVDDYVIIDLYRAWSDDGGWVEGEGWIDSLAEVRNQVLRGDLRALYLGWLLCVEAGELGDEDDEPPVPPELGNLSPSLQSLVEFLGIDEFLIEAAAEGSPAEPASESSLAEWIAELSAGEKDALLLRVAQGEQSHVSAELVRRFRAETRRSSSSAPRAARTVGELLARASELQDTYEREQRRRAEEERRRREQAEALARQKHLDALARRKDATWDDVESLVALKQARSYDKAVTLLVDLRDLAARDGDEQAFAARIAGLYDRHARKPAFIARLAKAGL